MEAFVLFSSVSALAGLPLQVGYAAANAGLDALAQLRRAHGKAALSVNWGRLRGGGMADSTPEARRLMGFLGRREISMGHVPPLLAAALGFADEVPNAMVANVDWSGFLAAGLPSKNSTRFGEFVLADDGGGAIAFRTELFALPDDQRLEVLTANLAEQVAAVMGIAAEAIDRHSPLPTSGWTHCRRSSFRHAWQQHWTSEFRRSISGGCRAYPRSRNRHWPGRSVVTSIDLPVFTFSSSSAPRAEERY